MKRLLTIGALAVSAMAYGETDYSKGVFIVNEDWYGHQNSTVNYLLPDNTDGDYWHYRVLQTENPGMELGCTNQFGAIWNGRFYLIAKQDKDPGAAVTGGRITVADATTMKILHQQPLIDPSGAQCDGRGFVGVSDHKGYISSSNGVWIFDLDTYTVTGMIEVTGNPNVGDDKPATDPAGSLYYGQSGTMVLVGSRVFLAHQQAGVMVIDTATDKVVETISPALISEKAGVGSLVLAKDGSVWASVAKDTSGTGFTMPYLLRIDPETLAIETVALAAGINAPSNSWYAWTPDTFCASTQTNTLYWSGGSNSWFAGKAVYKFDVDSRTATKIIDLDADGEKWKIYGCSMRVHPLTDELYVSLYHEFSIPTYILRRYDADGIKIRDYSMIENYWFPSLPVFPETTTNTYIYDVEVEESSANLIYNLQGLSVGDNFETLPQGLYITRGRKLLKR